MWQIGIKPNNAWPWTLKSRVLVDETVKLTVKLLFCTRTAQSSYPTVSVAVRVMSCKSVVNVGIYEIFYIDFYLFLVDNFKHIHHTNRHSPWISISPSLHKLLAHSWELIELNGGYGLGNLDELGLEECNQILRNVRSRLVWKTSQKINIVFSERERIVTIGVNNYH